jgi:hypothetical protein
VSSQVGDSGLARGDIINRYYSLGVASGTHPAPCALVGECAMGSKRKDRRHAHSGFEPALAGAANIMKGEDA